MKTLYVIATPIGNLDELSFRTISILKDLHYLVCESIERANKIIDKLKIKPKLITINKINEKFKLDTILNLLKNNDIGLITDAGMPTISDPGSILINYCHQNNVIVKTISGPSAIINALATAGFYKNEFIFLGFLPKKEKQIKDLIFKITELNYLICYYESPNRILNSISIINDILPKAEYFIIREMTKIYEQYIKGCYQEIYNKIETKGEFVVIINPNVEINDKISSKELNYQIKLLKNKNFTNREIILMLCYKYNFKKNYLMQFINEKNND